MDGIIWASRIEMYKRNSYAKKHFKASPQCTVLGKFFLKLHLGSRYWSA